MATAKCNLSGANIAISQRKKRPKWQLYMIYSQLWLPFQSGSLVEHDRHILLSKCICQHSKQLT